jgi:hypothetical protein
LKHTFKSVQQINGVFRYCVEGVGHGSPARID